MVVKILNFLIHDWLVQNVGKLSGIQEYRFYIIIVSMLEKFLLITPYLKKILGLAVELLDLLGVDLKHNDDIVVGVLAI